MTKSSKSRKEIILVNRNDVLGVEEGVGPEIGDHRGRGAGIIILRNIFTFFWLTYNLQ